MDRKYTMRAAQIQRQRELEIGMCKLVTVIAVIVAVLFTLDGFGL